MIILQTYIIVIGNDSDPGGMKLLFLLWLQWELESESFLVHVGWICLSQNRLELLGVEFWIERVWQTISAFYRIE